MDQAKKIKALEKKITGWVTMDRVKGLLLTAWFMFMGYLVFLAARFTELQSGLLTIIGFFALDAHRRANTPPPFRPFFVNIQPDWYLLAEDFGLVGGDRLQKLMAPLQKQSEYLDEDDEEADGEEEMHLSARKQGAAPTYNVLRDGIGFTVLSHTLMYSRDHKYFFSGNSIREDIAELTPGKKPRIGQPYPPQFYVERKVDKNDVPVFEFGLRTQESIEKANEWDSESENIVLAQLPWAVFWEYYDKFDWQKYAKLKLKRKALLEEYGWTVESEAPCLISQKYLKVLHGEI